MSYLVYLLTYPSSFDPAHLITFPSSPPCRTVWGHVELMTQWLTEMDKKLSAIKDNKKAVACQAIKIKLIFSQHMTHLVQHVQYNTRGGRM